MPGPTDGGIESCPVRNETIPVTASARMTGNEVTKNAFANAIPSFRGLLLDDRTPAASRMIAKITAATGLQFASMDGGGARTKRRQQTIH